MTKLYYTTPPEDVFNEVKKAAIEQWKTFDDTFGYATNKINRIKDLPNVEDNFMFIVSMFDPIQQRKLRNKLSAKARREVLDRLIDSVSII